MPSDLAPETPAPAVAASRPSAKDVARLAGVSTATVSRVLNTPEQVDVHTVHIDGDDAGGLTGIDE